MKLVDYNPSTILLLFHLNMSSKEKEKSSMGYDMVIKIIKKYGEASTLRQ